MKAIVIEKHGGPGVLQYKEVPKPEVGHGGLGGRGGDGAVGVGNTCRHYGLYGESFDGGCAEYVRATEVNVLPLPAGLSFEEAAAVPLVFLTSWHMLMTRGGLK